MHAATDEISAAERPCGQRLPNRWVIALAGAWLQLFLGTVYAWSYFQQLLVDAYGWANTQVAWTFSLAICFLGLAAAWGGTKLPRYGPRKLAAAGGILFGVGYLLAAAALQWRCLPLLYLGYGVIGGIGLGLAYVTPVATVAKWFPDKKGLATGLVIMGFGFGALLMSKLIAPTLCRWSGGNLVTVFLCLGACFTVATLLGAAALRNPPPGYLPPRSDTGRSASSDAAPGIVPATLAGSTSSPSESAEPVAIFSRRFIMMWLIFFSNIVAGIAIIGFQSPLVQDLWRRVDPSLSAESLAAYGATLIAVSALFNGVGRMFWGALSDRIGRLLAFQLMLASQLAVFLLLVGVGNPWVFGALICYVLLCYGGGFGTMPAFILDVFGPRRMPQAYGAILTAWSAGGVVGPQIVAFLKDHYAAHAASHSFFVGAGFLAVGLLLSLSLRQEPKT
jgi:OFA family oxalate/formate antiporter-like MFS transporter